MRMLRTARVQLQSRWIGDNIYHPAGSHAQLRNSIMRSYTAQHWYDALDRSEEHTSELQSLMRISYAVFCLKKKKKTQTLPLPLYIRDPNPHYPESYRQH